MIENPFSKILSFIGKKIVQNFESAKHNINRIRRSTGTPYTEIPRSSTGNVTETVSAIDPTITNNINQKIKPPDSYNFFSNASTAIGFGLALVGSISTVNTVFDNLEEEENQKKTVVVFNAYSDVNITLVTSYDLAIYKKTKSLWENNAKLHHLFGGKLENLLKLYINSPEEIQRHKEQTGEKLGAFNETKIEKFEEFLNAHCSTNSSVSLSKLQKNNLGYELLVADKERYNPTNIDYSKVPSTRVEKPNSYLNHDEPGPLGEGFDDCFGFNETKNGNSSPRGTLDLKDKK